MWSLLIAGALVLPAVDVNVQTLTAQELTGQLVQLDDQAAVIETSAGPQTVPLADLLTITPQTAAPAAPAAPRYWLRLIDGTQLPVEGYTVKDRQAIAVLAGGLRQEIPTRAIAWVRFRAPEAEIDPQWNQIVAQKAAGDVVVIRKSPTALDQLEGVLHEIDESTVQFEFDGDRIPVGLQKLEGVVYFHPLGQQLPRAACKLSTTDGSTWQARDLRLTDGKLAMTTAAGLRVELPWERVKALDYSSGNVVYLSDLEPETANWTPFMEIPALAAKLSRLYGPRRDKAFDGGKLQLDGKSFAKGLALHSRTELVFRLADSYRRLQAEYGIDEAVGDAGHVELVVLGDDRELFRAAVSGRDKPARLDVDITGVRRLKLLVDYGQQLDIADHLNLCNARMIK
ncbi:MAG: NPCBM/NEW2 domain-containing protein [Pirellulaceae bacterium]|nr:NPCBM/NEW2 domain-containing protein [Pirellulaceae bacterium]